MVRTNSVLIYTDRRVHPAANYHISASLNFCNDKRPAQNDSPRFVLNTVSKSILALTLQTLHFYKIREGVFQILEGLRYSCSASIKFCVFLMHSFLCPLTCTHCSSRHLTACPQCNEARRHCFESKILPSLSYKTFRIRICPTIIITTLFLFSSSYILQIGNLPGLQIATILFPNQKIARTRLQWISL